MRIQHNIMAMNAYRNYTNNVSAMKKNLERLSSGYKINRAGDDAAGLAISEKMRAQITGLETAQKNAKDGISLVQTAEGALTEVHDMLNRMIELATQSANGTYDNETDRYQLQKEMDQLMDEINRIADSSNFNGIKLLDGSMDASTIAGVSYDDLSSKKLQEIFEHWGTGWDGKTQPDVDDGKYVLETEGGASSRAGFEISLDDISVTTKDSKQTFSLDIGGGSALTVELDANRTYTATDIAKLIAEKYSGSDEKNRFAFEDINGEEHYFDIEADGKVLKFTVDVNDDVDFTMEKLSTVSWHVGDGEDTEEEDITQPENATPTIAPDGSYMTYDLTGFNVTEAGNYTFKINVPSSQADVEPADGGYSFTVNITDAFFNDGVLDLEQVAQALADAMNGDTGFKAMFKSIEADGTTVKLTANDNDTISDAWEDYAINVEKASSGGGVDGPGGDENPSVGSPASLTIEVTDAKLANAEEGDTITFSSDETDFSVTFEAVEDTEGGEGAIKWQISGSVTWPDGINDDDYDIAFENGKLIITAAKNGVVDANPFGDDITATATQSDSSGFDGEITIGTPAWVEGTNADTQISMHSAVGQAEASPATGEISITWGASVGEWKTGDKVQFEIGDSGVTITATYDESLNENDGGWNFTAEGITASDYTFNFETSGTSGTLTFEAKEPGLTELEIETSDTVTVTVTATGNDNADLTGSGTVESFQNGAEATEDADGSTSGTPSTGGTDSGYTTSNNVLGSVLSTGTLANLTTFDKSTSLTQAQAGELKDYFDGLGDTISVQGVDVPIDITDLLDGTETSIEEVAAKLLDRVQTAFEGNEDYEVVGISADAAGTVWLAGGDGTQALALSGGEGFYIQLKAKEDDTESGDYVATGTVDLGLQNVTNNNSGAAAQLANTTVDFDKVGAWQDGAQITIGDTTYTVAVGEGSKFKNVANVIDLTDFEAGEVDAKVAAQRLTQAAKNNSIFIVGHNGNGETTLKQRSEVKETTDMSTKERLLSYLGVSLADANSVTTAKPGHALTLQIGDTADSYNQLVVSISDCHTDSLGLGGISIADQDSAAAALDKIKSAINYVSDVRGTLGATQNRLDHTINNLSVMTENIQDAESTIRDTDIAEEMMAYTKNNILIQSAQAMLAQANQVPQGVLQLLQ